MKDYTKEVKMPQSVVAYTIAIDDLGKVLTKIEEPKITYLKGTRGKRRHS